MRSVMLEQLYSGNIGPAHMRPYETERSKFFSKQEDIFHKELEKKLDEQGRKLLTELLEAGNGKDESLAYGSFIHGFKMATLIMAEVFMDKECEMLSPRQYYNSRLHPPPDSIMDDEE